MQSDAETKIKQDLYVEILNLEQNYKVIEGFMAGKDYDVIISHKHQSFKQV
jgi:hypothetical protein